MIHNDRHQLAVSHQVTPSRKVKWSLNALKPMADFSSLVMYRRSGIFFRCRPVSSMLNTCWGLYPPPLLDDSPEMIWEGSSGVPVSALSLSQALNIMEPIAGLKLIKPARAGRELRHGACLLLLEVVEALHGLLFGVVEGHVQALMLPMIHSCDQHFLCTDHDVGLARRHLGRTTICSYFYG